MLPFDAGDKADGFNDEVFEGLLVKIEDVKEFGADGMDLT